LSARLLAEAVVNWKTLRRPLRRVCYNLGDKVVTATGFELITVIIGIIVGYANFLGDIRIGAKPVLAVQPSKLRSNEV